MLMLAFPTLDAMETTGGIKEAVVSGSAREEYTVTVGMTAGTTQDDLDALLEADDTILRDIGFDMYQVRANGATLRRLFNEDPRIIAFIEPVATGRPYVEHDGSGI